MEARALLLILSILTANAEKRKRYDNYHVYELFIFRQDQLMMLQALDGDRDDFIFLNDVVYVEAHINVVVAPHAITRLKKILEAGKIVYKLLDTNAQAHLEYDDVEHIYRGNGVYSWLQYYRLNDTYNWLESLPLKFRQVSLINAGRSYEGREILGVKISYGEGKRGIFIEGGMHAREWISPATTTYIINELLSSNNMEVRIIAESFDWYILPHVNPDGYVYSHTTDRMWRKTRTPYGNCFGADPNRNWDFHWNEVGASSNICSDTYAGPFAFSEVEIASLAKYLLTLRDKIQLYVSIHSYSQLLLFPYGYTSECPSNYEDLKRVFAAAIAGIQRRYGTKYTGGNIYDSIYPSSGSSIDWTYGINGILYSFVYELRPSSLNLWTGFKLPASQIIPTGQETLDSLMEMVKEIDRTNLEQ